MCSDEEESFAMLTLLSFSKGTIIKMNSMKEKPGILIPNDILAILRHWEADPFSSQIYDNQQEQS